MLNAQDSRNESSPTRIARAAAVFMVLIVMGYAVTTQVESAVSMQATPIAQVAQQDATPTPYFPAQYVNQGTEIDEHIPSF